MRAIGNENFKNYLIGVTPPDVPTFSDQSRVNRRNVGRLLAVNSQQSAVSNYYAHKSVHSSNSLLFFRSFFLLLHLKALMDLSRRFAACYCYIVFKLLIGSSMLFLPLVYLIVEIYQMTSINPTSTFWLARFSNSRSCFLFLFAAASIAFKCCGAFW